ncbi:FAD-dependent oxidoreductase, partial [Rhizobium leguminosarum]|uniref:FAD-dependent oxidoreductase n=1 Tax=Rhizobium leguminosarum TaxID=384 RepID=UPI001C912B3D
MQVQNYDIAIIGAGPAGISAALHLIETDFPGSVILIEAGRPHHKRPCPADKGKSCRSCGNICNVISGFGGSIHFGDAVKLSRFPSGRRLMEQLGEERAEAMCNLAMEYLFPDVEAKVVRPPKDYRGFTLKTYPLMSVGEEAVSTMIERTYDRIIADDRTSLLFNTAVTEIMPLGDGFLLNTKSRTEGNITISVGRVIVSVGRKGQSWWKDELRRLGLKHTTPTSSVGVRFECPSDALRDVAFVHPDFKTTVTENDVKVKTFCFCAGQSGGRIKFTDYVTHTFLDGHVVVDHPVPTSNFALMAQLRDENGQARTAEWIEEN